MHSKEMKLVVEYLKSECYTDTLSAIQGSQDACVSFRQKIKEEILSGRIDEASKSLEEKFPDMFQAPTEVSSLLHSQKFIELVRNGEPEKALSFGRTCIQNGEDITKTNDLFLLLAYQNPEHSDVLKDFLSLERREMVFSSIDALVKERLYGNKVSQIEYMMRLLDLAEWMKKAE
ncbi:hypothetical protein NECID01_0119 [Nematocida sp. AWRm77]|nr:hypothetical protein NECID01_0119 [Nematocida sp. AWRm77]